MPINARSIVGTGFPPEDGRKLAKVLLGQKEIEWRGLEIDLRECAPGLLISAFFNGFLQQVYDTNPALLDPARKVTWTVAFPFQLENIKIWMKRFKPFVPNSSDKTAQPA